MVTVGGAVSGAVSGAQWVVQWVVQWMVTVGGAASSAVSHAELTRHEDTIRIVRAGICHRVHIHCVVTLLSGKRSPRQIALKVHTDRAPLRVAIFGRKVRRSHTRGVVWQYTSSRHDREGCRCGIGSSSPC